MELDIIIKDISFEDPEFINKCVLISQDITSGKLPVLNLIEKLDFLLTNNLSEKRELGLNVLCQIFEKLPMDFLSPQQVEVISIFFINKLKDHHQVAPVAIKGLISIVRQKHFPPEHAPIILTSLVDNISCQQQQQIDRFNIYTLFGILMGNFTNELQSMGINFTYSIITSIDGERDPRNLLFLFDLMNKYLKIIPLGHLVEDMFDVLACYFPIDFKTPPNNSTITRENLANSLCPCLCAVPEFGEPCIQLALEKLDSSLDIAKIDSLNLLREGCKNFTSDSYIDNFFKIWSQIQKEIFTTSNQHLQQLSLDTLKFVVNKASYGDQTKFKKFIVDVVGSLKGNLLPELKHYQITIRILLYVASGSAPSSAVVVTEVSPILTNTFSIATNDYKPAILHYLVGFIKTCLEQNGKEQFNKEFELVMTLCFQSISDQNEMLRKEVFDSFNNLSLYLTEDMRCLLYKSVSNLFVSSKNEIVKTAFNNCLLALAKNYDSEIQNLISNIKIGDNISLDSYLTSLCCLSTLDNFKMLTIQTFIKYLNDSSETACTVIKHLKKLLATEDGSANNIFLGIEKNLIGILIEISINHISDVNLINSLLDVGDVIKMLIGSQESLTQSVIVHNWLKQLLSGIETKESFVVLIAGLLERLDPDVEVEYELFEKLFHTALSCEGVRNREVSVQLLANLLNKMKIGDVLNSQLDNLMLKCNQQLKSSPSKIILVMSWISKALLTRNHPKSMEWLNLLFSNIENSPEAVEGFKIIMDDTYDCLGQKSKCIKMPLFQQKIFVFIIDKILVDVAEFTKPYNLKIFGIVLGHVPKEVVAINFKKISKLILLCIDNAEDEDTLWIVLQTIQNVMRSNKDEIEEQLDDYVLRILKLTTFNNSMKVRIAAICFIKGLLSTSPIYKLLLVKGAVLEQLGNCVDDKKRLVRQIAMETRSLWYLIDSPVD